MNRLLFSNAFKRFGIPVSFKIDQRTCKEKYYMLMKQIHPDISQIENEESRIINYDIKTLLNPISRAELILKIKDIHYTTEQNNEVIIEVMEMIEDKMADHTFISNSLYLRLEKAFESNDEKEMVKSYLIYKYWVTNRQF